MNVQIKRARGTEIGSWLDALAELRIRIFRDWPYLYDGSLAYECSYLTGYANSPNSMVVLALSGNEVIGCSTGLPMTDADLAFQQPFLKAGYDMRRVFYFGESVLDHAWRGHGIGHRFFDERESHARSLGFDQTTFCAVQRPDSHPLRPRNYRPLDQFWHNRGYRPIQSLQTHFSWKDVDQDHETSKTMQFWIREA